MTSPSPTPGWIGKGTDGASSFDRVFGLLPTTYRYYREFYGQLWSSAAVDPAILEICRLRIAQLLGCESEQRLRYQPAIDAGLTEEKIGQLASYHSSALYSDGERACLNFAEKFVMDPHGIADEEADAVKAVVGSGELAVFAVALALFDGFSRFRVFLGIEPDHNEGFVAPAPGPAPASLP